MKCVNANNRTVDVRSVDGLTGLVRSVSVQSLCLVVEYHEFSSFEAGRDEALLSYSASYPSQERLLEAAENFLGQSRDRWRDYTKEPFVDWARDSGALLEKIGRGSEFPVGTRFKRQNLHTKQPQKSLLGPIAKPTAAREAGPASFYDSNLVTVDVRQLPYPGILRSVALDGLGRVRLEYGAYSSYLDDPTFGYFCSYSGCYRDLESAIGALEEFLDRPIRKWRVTDLRSVFDFESIDNYLRGLMISGSELPLGEFVCRPAPVFSGAGRFRNLWSP